jgi:hypothetical protein
LIECTDVQALPAPFSREPLSLPPTSRTAIEVIRSRHSQLGKPVNPLVRCCFRLTHGRLVAFWRGRARGGPEELIKMATGQLRRRLRYEAIIITELW